MTIDMRKAMPETAKWVNARRAEYGPEFVNDMVRRGCGQAGAAGEPGCFYALEGGHVIGTPFPPGHPITPDIRMAVMTGCTFAAFMAMPPRKT